jgi:hypothetical protein
MWLAISAVTLSVALEAVTLARQASLMIIGERRRAEYGVIDVPLREQLTELLGQLERNEKY